MYISSVSCGEWEKGITHDVVKVVCGISFTALQPRLAAADCLSALDILLRQTKEAEPGRNGSQRRLLLSHRGSLKSCASTSSINSPDIIA